mgnify:CR=1 FL=1
MKFYILGPIILGLILTTIFLTFIYLYKKHLNDKKVKSYSLLSLRSISLTILLILFFEPFINYYSNKIVDKKINIFVDNSKSISKAVSSNEMISYIDSIEVWADNKDYKLSYYTFGEELVEGGSIDFTDSSTIYKGVVNKINTSPKHLNILFTDGIQTHGFGLSDLTLDNPINIIGLGPLENQEISIDEVLFPIYINSGDSINIQIMINSLLSSNIDCVLEVMDQKSLLFSKDITLAGGENIYNYNIMIPTEKKSAGKLDLTISVLANSIMENKQDNSFKIQTIITDNYKKVLFISGSLNSNTQIITNLLNQIDGVEIKNLYRINNKWNLPIEDIDFSNIDFILYDNFPLSKLDNDIFSSIERDKLKKTKSIFFEGPDYDFNTLNHILFDGKDISKDKGDRKTLKNKNSYLNNLVPVNKNFSINKSFKTTYLNYSDESIAIAESDNRFYVFIPELSKIFINDSYDFFKNYLYNLIFLYIDFGEQIILGTNKTEISNGENLYIDINHPEVYEKMNFKLLVENIKNNEIQKINFNKIQNDNNNRKYIDSLSNGEYLISVEGLSDNQLYKSNKIKITVNPNILELNKSYRAVGELQMAALKSNGNYFDIESYEKINSLLNSAISIKKNKIELNIHSFHKFWFILLITLIIEWFLRKRKGLL